MMEPIPVMARLRASSLAWRAASVTTPYDNTPTARGEPVEARAARVRDSAHPELVEGWAVWPRLGGDGDLENPLRLGAEQLDGLGRVGQLHPVGYKGRELGVAVLTR